MFLVQLLHLTFGFQASRKRGPNVRCAALACAPVDGAHANFSAIQNNTAGLRVGFKAVVGDASSEIYIRHYSQ